MNVPIPRNIGSLGEQFEVQVRSLHPEIPVEPDVNGFLYWVNGVGWTFFLAW